MVLSDRTIREEIAAGRIWFSEIPGNRILTLEKVQKISRRRLRSEETFPLYCIQANSFWLVPLSILNCQIIL